MRQCQNRPDQRAVECQQIDRADSEHRSQRECIEGYSDIVGDNLARSHLVGPIEVLPPMSPGFYYRLAPARRHAGQLGEFRIAISPEIEKSAEDDEDRKRCRRVPPRATKCLREVMSKEAQNAPAALGVGAIDA